MGASKAVYENVSNWMRSKFGALRRGVAENPVRSFAVNVPCTEYPDNCVTSTKFTYFSFFPKGIAQQFNRTLNRYFLLIACLQCWKDVAPVHPLAIWGPLSFVLMISLVKEAHDDIGRRKRDKIANSRVYQVLRNGELVDVPSEALHVGQIVRIADSQEIPCDCIALVTSDPSGECHIQTTNLDGETDLKSRFCCPTLNNDLSAQQLRHIQGECKCESPSGDLYNFTGHVSITCPKALEDTVGIDNLLLQSCTLRNTSYVFALVIYTGNDTKVGHNNRQPRTKVSKMDKNMDRMMMRLILIQILISFVIGMTGDYYSRSRSDLWYLALDNQRTWFSSLVIPIRFLLLISIMVPISLKVTVELAKYTFSLFIDWDQKLVEEGLEHAHSIETGIPDELGQIECILTDKTGTLTENAMILRKASINGVIYDMSMPSEPTSPHVRDSQRSMPFFRCLGLCNTVTPTLGLEHGPRASESEIIYKTSSPDEAALVVTAGNHNVCLIHRSHDRIEILVRGRLEAYQILHVLDFTSARKRMSVVVKGPLQDHGEIDVTPQFQAGYLQPSTIDGIEETFNFIEGDVVDGSAEKDFVNGKCGIWVISKGADDVMLQSLKENHPNLDVHMRHVKLFADKGLRTLMMGIRGLTEAEWEDAHDKLLAANRTILDRTDALAHAYSVIERDLSVVGITAIEDSLQKEVPETIQQLKAARIAFWMVTGDRRETAMQIGLTSGLRTVDDYLIALDQEGDSECPPASLYEERLDAALAELIARDTSDAVGTITMSVSGTVVEHVLAVVRDKFLDVAGKCNSVICYRVTPSQKAKIAAAVKERKVVLAIGDGGNDVQMLQTADIGIGLRGKEGMQASMASDITMDKFRFLKRLILVHGTYSHHRLGLMIQFSVYKSVYIALLQIIYNTMFAFLCGISLFEAFSLLGYNSLFTMFPVFFYIFDKDVPETAIENHPELYLRTQLSMNFNFGTFTLWLVRAFFQATVVSLIGFTNEIREDKHEMGLSIYTFIVLTVTLTLAVESKYVALAHLVLCLCQILFLSVSKFVFEIMRSASQITIACNSYWTWVNHLWIWGTIMLFFSIVSAASWIRMLGYEGAIFHLEGRTDFWLSCILASAVCCLVHTGSRYYFNVVRPNPTYHHRVRYLQTERHGLRKDESWIGTGVRPLLLPS